ncbi:ribonuclease P protein component [Actinomadura harenae]|uniref:Ribonuclease P protein component n=2 Tax=Actinomadura harenae TaxID=2483351 RepID=A0A3M2LMD2_9ACTN|nr:ribonuclease P protein component [Actinomadura harenae]RMI37693.1 ribonuclease P protein component [Actinomadura harenae]
MRRRDDFTLAVRRGRRAGRPTVVVHLLRRDPSAAPLPAEARADSRPANAVAPRDEERRSPGRGGHPAGPGDRPLQASRDTSGTSQGDAVQEAIAGSATGEPQPVENRSVSANDTSHSVVSTGVDNVSGNGAGHLSPLEPGVSGREEPALVGFIVARTVGNAVVRNQVRRRLRHLVRARLERLPEGSLLVVRANPAAGTARGDELAADLDSALDRVLRQTTKGRT